MNDLWTAKEFLSAVIGAIVGGAIGLLGQWLTIRQARRVRKSEASDRQSALGHSLIFKMIKIHSQLDNLRKFMQEAIGRKKDIGPDAEYWQFVLPVANLPNDVIFDAGEMGMMLSLGHHDVFNNILGIDVVHNDLIAIFSTYRNIRSEVSKELPQNIFKGQIGSFGITPNQYAALKPRMIELNYLADQMFDRCNKDTAKAWEALQQTNAVLRAQNIMKYEVDIK